MYVQQGKGLRRHVETHPHVPPTSLAERSIVQLNLPCCSKYSTFLRKTSTLITMCQSTTCSTCRKFRASRPRTTTAFCQSQKSPYETQHINQLFTCIGKTSLTKKSHRGQNLDGLRLAHSLGSRLCSRESVVLVRTAGREGWQDVSSWRYAVLFKSS